MGILDKIKQATGLQEEENKSLVAQVGQQVDDAITLTWKQRFIGFGVCVGVGILLSIISLFLLWGMNITGFAVCYSLGAIISLCSTMFLMGPFNQIKRMMDQHRLIATLCYLACIVATLVVAFKTHNALLCLLCIFFQFLALCWYVITYIPGGQATLKALVFRAG